MGDGRASSGDYRKDGSKLKLHLVMLRDIVLVGCLELNFPALGKGESAQLSKGHLSRPMTALSLFQVETISYNAAITPNYHPGRALNLSF